MAWDDSKSTAVDPDNPDGDEQLTADEWNDHVDEGHWPADELNLEMDGGDPVLRDQVSNDVVLRWDRDAGSWVMESLQTEEVNTVGFADASDGVESVQTVLDEAETPAHIFVYSSEGDVTWDERLEIPNNVRCEAWGDYEIALSNRTDLDPIDIRNGGFFYTMLVNKDRSGSGEGVEIAGFNLDYGGDSNDDENKAGICLHQMNDGLIEDCEVNNVAGSLSGRQYNFLTSDSEGVTVRNCKGDVAGYENFAIRGDNKDIRHINCHGTNPQESTANLQAGAHTGKGLDREGVFDNVYFEGCTGDSVLRLHGNEESQGADRASRNATIRECGPIRIEALGWNDNVRIRDCVGSVRIRGDVESVFNGLVVDGLEFDDTTNDRIIELDPSDQALSVNDMTIRDVHADDSEHILRVKETNSPGEFNCDRIRFADCTNIGDGIVGMFVTREEVGSVTFRSCYCEADEWLRSQNDGFIESVLFTGENDFSGVLEVVGLVDGGSIGPVIENGSTGQMGTRFHLSTNQTISSGTKTTVAFDSTSSGSDFEDSTLFNADTTANEIVVQAAGTYYISAQTIWESSSNWSRDEVRTELWAADDVRQLQATAHHGENEFLSQNVTSLVTLDANDSIYVDVEQSSGNDQDLLGDTQTTYLEVHRVNNDLISDVF